jgi:hypothetical protein
LWLAGFAWATGSDRGLAVENSTMGVAERDPLRILRVTGCILWDEIPYLAQGLALICRPVNNQSIAMRARIVVCAAAATRN